MLLWVSGQIPGYTIHHGKIAQEKAKCLLDITGNLGCRKDIESRKLKLAIYLLWSFFKHGRLSIDLLLSDAHASCSFAISHLLKDTSKAGGARLSSLLSLIGIS